MYIGARVISLTISVCAGYGSVKGEDFLANGVLSSFCQCSWCGLGEGDGR